MSDGPARRRPRRHEHAVSLANQAIRHHVESCGDGPWTPEQSAVYQILVDAYVTALRARDREPQAADEEPEPAAA